MTYLAQILPTAFIALVICAIVCIASLVADEDEDQEVAGQYLTRYGMYPSWYIPSAVPGAIKPAYYYFRVPSKVAVYSAGSKDPKFM